MVEMITCPQGHTWERPPLSVGGGLLRCPTCGLALATRATVAPPDPDRSDETGDGFGPQVSGGATFVETGLRAPFNEDVPSRRGRFRVLREHAHGGLGQVSVARDEDLGRDVALKEIRPELAASAHSRERFVHEARITGQLEHPNIVPVYALGRDEHGRPYYAMRFVKGRTLAQAVAEYHAAPTPRGLRDLLTRFVHVCQAIAYAHSRGIIHRDLKPLNVMLGDYGETLILDWGLAKHVGDAAPADGPDVDAVGTPARHEPGPPQMTRAGQLLGTPAYMAPEQARQAADAGPPADVYSLGAILHEILYGRPPGETRSTAPSLSSPSTAAPAAVAAAAGARPPGGAPPVPRPLQSVCRKALAPEPVARYASADALGEDVERFVADEPVHAHRDRLPARLARWARRHKATAVGLVALVVTATIALAVSNALVRRQRDQKVVALGEATRQADLARAAEARARGALVAAHVRRGWELCDQGNPSLSLLYFTRALEMDAGDGRAEADHRLRIATVLASSPRLCDGVTAEFRGLTVHGNSWLHWEWDNRKVVVSELASGQPVGAPLTHDGEIAIANFSPDGTRVLTAAGDGTARVWDAATGAPVTPPLAHAPGAYVPDGNFSPDGMRVATASYDDVRVWEVAGGRLLFDPIRLGTSSMSATFSPDGTKLLVVGVDGSRIYDAATGGPLTGMMETKTNWMNHTAHGVFSGDGLRVATYNGAATVRVWDAATGEPLSAELSCEKQPCLAFRRDGTRLIVGDAEALRVWDETSPEAWHTPVARGDRVEHVGYSPDERSFYSTWGDFTVRVWEAKTLEPLTPPLPHPAAIAGAAFTPDGRHLVTVDGERTVRAWEAAETWPSGVIRRTGMNHTELAHTRGVRFDAARKRLVMLSNSDTATRVWEAATHAPLTPYVEHGSPVYEADFSPDGAAVVTGTKDGKVRVWDAATGKVLVGPIPAADSPVTSVEFSHDGRWLASGSQGGAVRVWDARTGSPRTPPIVCAGEAGVEFAPDDRRVLTWDDTAARVWDARTGAAATPPMEHGHDLEWAELKADGRRVLTYGTDAARLWDAATGGAVGRPMAHGSDVNYADVSPNGRVVATAGRDRTARLWDADTGLPLTSPLAHPEPVHLVTFLDGGRRLLTGCPVSGMRLWDVRTGEALTPAVPVNDVWDHFELAPDGRELIADGRHTSEVRAWDLAPEARPAADLARLAELLSARRLDEQGGAVPLTADEWAQRRRALTRRYPYQFTPAAVTTRPVAPATGRAGARRNGDPTTP
jgi:WD40 repeat protein/serine/threonine protein kinase